MTIAVANNQPGLQERLCLAGTAYVGGCRQPPSAETGRSELLDEPLGTGLFDASNVAQGPGDQGIEEGNRTVRQTPVVLLNPGSDDGKQGATQHAAHHGRTLHGGAITTETVHQRRGLIPG